MLKSISAVTPVDLAGKADTVLAGRHAFAAGADYGEGAVSALDVGESGAGRIRRRLAAARDPGRPARHRAGAALRQS